MPKGQYIANIGSYIEEIEYIGDDATILLFRGQDCNEPLLPKIARPNPKIDTIDKERQMLAELKRRTARNPALLGKDDWDALVVAQHFGMATRLLDWTTNPLIALWFAVSNLDALSSGYVYMLPVTEDLILGPESDPDPFDFGKTRVFKPSINNERIAAQAGWFTAHRYSPAKQRGSLIFTKTES